MSTAILSDKTRSRIQELLNDIRSDGNYFMIKSGQSADTNNVPDILLTLPHGSSDVPGKTTPEKASGGVFSLNDWSANGEGLCSRI